MDEVSGTGELFSVSATDTEKSRKENVIPVKRKINNLCEDKKMGIKEGLGR